MRMPHGAIAKARKHRHERRARSDREALIDTGAASPRHSAVRGPSGSGWTAATGSDAVSCRSVVPVGIAHRARCSRGGTVDHSAKEAEQCHADAKRDEPNIDHPTQGSRPGVPGIQRGLQFHTLGTQLGFRAGDEVLGGDVSQILNESTRLFVPQDRVCGTQLRVACRRERGGSNLASVLDCGTDPLTISTRWPVPASAD